MTRFISAALLVSVALISQAQENTYAQEIRAASEAAPSHIADQASFLTFENQRFKLIQQGSNNFTCLVMRSPEGRFEPACLNEQAVRSILPTYEKHMQLRWKGYSKAQTMHKLALAFQQGELPSAEVAALVYMMSSNNRGAKEDGVFYPIPAHQMYFLPKIDDDVFRLEGTGVRLWQGYPHLTALIVDVSGTQTAHQH